jgi:pimeloyl-ACP methyl ester carboxylesterase
MITKLNIPCVWGGHLAGILMKNYATTDITKATTKIIGIHGWLDNLNSMLPLAEKLIERHPNYEIYLYDRAGHGFSSHLPKGCDYSMDSNLRDLRIIIQSESYSYSQ